MANSIAAVKNYTAVLDEVYKRAACSTCLNSPRRMARAGRNAKEIMIPKIEVTGLGDYTRNVGYKTGSITYEFETKAFNYDRGIKLLVNVMNVSKRQACLTALWQRALSSSTRRWCRRRTPSPSLRSRSMRARRPPSRTSWKRRPETVAEPEVGVRARNVGAPVRERTVQLSGISAVV